MLDRLWGSCTFRLHQVYAVHQVLKRAIGRIFELLPFRRLWSIRHRDPFKPSEEDIDAVLKRLDAVKALSTSPFDAWFDLGEGQGIKVRATLSEARTMEYLRKHSSIPIPRVIMAFERAEEAFIVTERVEGDTLRNLCMADVLDEGQTISIAKQLAGYLTELHTLDSIPVSERTLGSWPNGPFRNLFFYCSWSSAPVPLPSVAYRTTQEFHQYWLSRLRLTPKALNALQNAIDTAPPPGHPILSHGDLNARNILVKDARIVGIIDWETFGWWPDFWETMSMRRGGRNSPKWRTAIPAVFGSQTEMESAYSSALDALTMLDMFQ